MRWLLSMWVKALTLLTPAALMIILFADFDSIGLSTNEIMFHAFYSLIETPTWSPYPPPIAHEMPPYPPPLVSELPTYPPPPTTVPYQNPPAACPPQTQWGAFEADVELEGLPGVEQVMVRMQPIREDIVACLAARGTTLPEMTFGNGNHRFQLQEIPVSS